MSGYYRNSSHYHNPDESFDPFSSPQQSSWGNQRGPMSSNVLEASSRRRSSGESNSIGRAIQNALDPEYWDEKDLFAPSTSTVNYDDDASILAAVSSAHSSQEMDSQSSSSSAPSQGQKRKVKPKPQLDVAPIFNSPSKPKTNEDALMKDFLSPDSIARYRIQQRRQRPKQVRMDDFLFKARRVDKGAREFGLHTTHEPKRGSKKKRDSIEVLEVEKADFERMRQKKKEAVMEQRTVEDLDDFSLAFGTPSPVRSKRPKTSKLTKFFDKDPERPSRLSSAPQSSSSQSPPKRSITVHDPNLYSSDTVLNDTVCSTQAMSSLSPARAKPLKTSKLTKFFDKSPSRSLAFQSPKRSSITVNNPSRYSSESVLDETVCSTPNKSILPETVPFGTPSPPKTPKRTLSGTRPSGRPILDMPKPNPVKRRDPESFEKAPLKQSILFILSSQHRQPLVQAKRQRYMSSNRKPEFDFPSSPITLSDDEDVKMKASKREILLMEEQERKSFGRHVSDREQMMKSLVDQKFKEERENGGIERRRAELKDGEVVRNKEMRKNLMHGAACKCCRKYYDGLAMEEEEKKEYIDKISRHRYVHQPLPDTPERYWDLTLGPEDDDIQPEMTQSRKWESVAKKKKEKTGIQNWD